MGVYARKQKLWIRYRDAAGKWRDAFSGYLVGQETLARAVYDGVVAEIAKRRHAPVGLTVRALAEAWLAKRSTETVGDDRGRIYNHILPALGHILVSELRPRQIRDFVETLTAKRRQGHRRKDGSLVPTEELLAPRTVRHIYGTLRAMLNDAVADEIIPSSPCVLKDELPAKRDKDRTWRRTAVFTRDEVELIISAESTPDDRRVLDALMFLGAMRFGEAAALAWRDYDATCAPLGKLVIERSYSTRSHRIKATKTENPREMPVHPTLARILATWKLGGFERVFGRKPQPEDLIVPSRRDRPRGADYALRCFHEDLERIGLRARRQHDARRTFISIARADGARADILRWATHGPTGDITDQYTTLPWDALCAEVAKVRLNLREGKLIAMPMPMPVVVGASGLAIGPLPAAEFGVMTDGYERPQRDSNSPTLDVQCRQDAHSSSEPQRLRVLASLDASVEVASSLPADPIAAELETALALRRAGADDRELRRVLRRVAELLATSE